MPILYQVTVWRRDLKLNPHVLYVFGDNWTGKGYGGQAREMRGEPNAVGVPTKRKPSRDVDAFLCDDDIGPTMARWEGPFMRIEAHLLAGGLVVIPANGIGSGRAELAKHAPRIAEALLDRMRGLTVIAEHAARKLEPAE